MALSNRIRGITVEINGDTTGLGNAFRDIDRQASQLQNELNEVNRMLQFDPSNTELLAQQQELYNRQLSTSRQRLEQLRQVESQMQQQLAAGTIGAEEMRAFQREIIRTEQRIRQTEESIDNLGQSAENAGRSGEAMADKIKSGLNKATLAIGTAVGAVGTAGVMAFDDMTKALNQFQASTGTAETEMEGIEQAIKDIYNNNIGESFDDIARAMAEVAQQTNLSGEELQQTTSYALMLRDVFDLDVNEGVRGANALMKQFGISAEEAYNLIAIGAQNGLNQNQDLADQIAEYSVYYAEMGFSVEEMFQKMSAGVETGAYQVDFLNDAMKEFGIRTKDASDGTMQAFAQMGLDAEALTDAFANGGASARAAFDEVIGAFNELESETEKNSIGVALFGTKWEDVGIKGMDALANLNGSIDTTKNALAEIAEIKYDSIGEAFQGIGRQLQTGLLIPIGEALLPALEAVSTGLQILLDHMDLIGPIAAGLAAGIVTLTAAIQGQTVATKAAQIAQGLLNAVMKANPMAIVVTAIVAVSTALIALWTTNEDFRNAVTAIWKAITDMFQEKVEAIKKFFSDLVTSWKQTWEKNTAAFENSVKQIKDLFNGLKDNLAKIGENIKNTIAQSWEKIKNFFSETIPNIVSIIINGFTGLPSKMIEVGSNIIDGVKKGITEKVSSLYNGVKDIGTNIASVFRNILRINSPSLVFQLMGQNIVEGLQLGISSNASLATNEITRLGEMILQSGDAISTSLINVDKKTGQLLYDNTYTSIMKKLSLYYKDRDSRVAAMTDGTNDNINQIQREIDATRTATDLKIKMYQQEYNAKVALIDRETNEQTRALQERIDAINREAEEERRQEEELTYRQRMQELNQQLADAQTDEDRASIKKQMDEQIRSREKQLLQQQRQDEQEALRQEMEDIRAQAEEKKQSLQEELEAKQYALEQQRIAEINHLNAVLKLMQEQVKKKEELEKVQTQIVEKEKQLQTKKMDQETKKQTQIDLAQLKEQEKNLIASINNDKTTLEQFTPTIQNISSQYGQAFLNGFTSTENDIRSYIDRMVDYMQSKLSEATSVAVSLKHDGSHRLGLKYVPYDNYSAVLHEGERVLTKAENQRYSAGNTGQTVNNFFELKDVTVRSDSDINRIAERLFHLQKNDARGKGIRV